MRIWQKVAAVIGSMALVSAAGVGITAALPAAASPPVTLTLRGVRQSQLTTDLNAVPPAHLMQRVTRTDDPAEYQDAGVRLAARLMEAVRAHAGRPVVDVLDWGCGPGRIASHLAADPRVTLYGCDPDAEAVAWAREHIRGSFEVSPLWPPLRYGDGSFDAVVAMSVFTHMPRRAQRLWLRDLARVLRPGGVLAASVHGVAAARGLGVPGIPAGIDDRWLDDAMHGVLPDGYYGVTLQTEEYTRRAWSDRFEVVAWEEAALDLHDLVVAQVRSLATCCIRRGILCCVSSSAVCVCTGGSGSSRAVACTVRGGAGRKRNGRVPSSLWAR